ncbi:uncharacterized protein LOC106882408 [Octopus bimaculoides]|uniref:uncharacterized protein LOC106882408 n=1 Tax=Octopus bimaculoides TaxID=37653 RepID=UPI00071D2C7E|nr:uncharacterized protein LOC106882408 [Octopus bimaculoides]|eukprot:XP_014788566.1 PREDICTED: uncharacterized protein LOC106882408 [Octopus bimaculoides]
MHPALFVQAVGKLVMEDLGTSNSSHNFSSHHAFFVKDCASNKSFMVDTGFSCSIWPLCLTSDKPKKSAINLHTVNLSLIKTYGQVSLNPDLNLQRDFRWVFVIADLPYPILGVDFLNHFHLLVDVRQQSLMDDSTSLFTPAQVTTKAVFSPSFFVTTAGDQFHSLSASFPEVVDLTFKSVKVTHLTRHYITTSGPAVFLRPQ